MLELLLQFWTNGHAWIIWSLDVCFFDAIYIFWRALNSTILQQSICTQTKQIQSMGIKEPLKVIYSKEKNEVNSTQLSKLDPPAVDFSSYTYTLIQFSELPM